MENNELQAILVGSTITLLILLIIYIVLRIRYSKYEDKPKWDNTEFDVDVRAMNKNELIEETKKGNVEAEAELVARYSFTDRDIVKIKNSNRLI